MKRHHLMLVRMLLVLILLALFTGLGWFFGQKSAQSSQSENRSENMSANNTKTVQSVNGVVQDDSGKTVKYWYDPMVPNQKFDQPGKSPFMDMMLEPKYANEGSASEGRDGEEGGVAISSQTVQNLGIRFEKVSKTSFGESLSAVGRIEADERRFYAVQTRVPGFVEKLFIRAIGDPVSKGQKIAEIYAPEILAAQQEYLALTTLGQVDADGALKQAARSRLTLLGMSEGEITAITKTGKANPRFGVYAPANGVLTELGAREGAQLMSGTSFMQIADLSQVWLVAEVPERDAAKLKSGLDAKLDAKVQLQSLAGETFKGKVSYLYPMLNNASRTLQVRVELPNKQNRLRPGMYGNVLFTGQTYEALSVPTESIIATGKRNIVIVKEANGYRPVEVTAGQERNGRTEILSGLAEAEDVVVSGQFLIDSEASLSGVLARLAQQDHTMKMPGEMSSEMPVEKSIEKSVEKSTSTEKTLKGRGKVVEIEMQSGQVTLNHDPIAALDWPAMTMGFKVKDHGQLGKLNVGDAVTFDLKPDEPDQYMILHIAKIAPVKNNMHGEKP